MPELAAMEQSLQQYSDDAKAPNTQLAYAKQWRQFEAWCATKAFSALPAAPETVALYLAACADAELAVATLEQAKAAITYHHDEAALASPCASVVVKKAWQGIRRRLGTAPTQKHPVDADQLRAMYRALPDGLLGVRDRALIGLGFSGAFRRGELVALDVHNLAFVRRGLEVCVQRSKTDQEGRGFTKNIARGSDPTTCPVRGRARLARARARRRWPGLPQRRPARQRQPQATERAIGGPRPQARGRRRRFPTDDLSGHSLRAGFVTEAKKHGADDAAIMDQTGYRSLAMVQRYHRRAKKWEKPASEKLGL